MAFSRVQYLCKISFRLDTHDGAQRSNLSSHNEQIPYPGPIYFLGKFLRRFAIHVIVRERGEANKPQRLVSLVNPWT
jgi:hypothetical protein